jgi:hypothetical protein
MFLRNAQEPKLCNMLDAKRRSCVISIGRHVSMTQQTSSCQKKTGSEVKATYRTEEGFYRIASRPNDHNAAAPPTRPPDISIGFVPLVLLKIMPVSPPAMIDFALSATSKLEYIDGDRGLQTFSKRCRTSHISN